MKATNTLLLATLLSFAAWGLGVTNSAHATTINGDLQFGGGAPPSFNGFDPVNGEAPAGDGNASQSTAVTVGPGVEFGQLEPGLVLITADFTANSLVIQNMCVSLQGGCVNSVLLVGVTFTFTASTPGFFNDLLKVGDTFVGGVTDTLVGDTLTVSWAGSQSWSGSQDATFSFTAPVSATPLPATLPLFAGGLGVVGFLAKRRKRNASRALAAA
jgi:hypothetical protein